MSSQYFKITEHTVDTQHIRQYPHATINGQEEVLKLAVKQYTPLDNPNPRPGDVTILAAHANGFPKELYEPLWDDLLAKSKANNFRIRSIWIADVAQQGISSVVNEDVLGNDPSWFDHPRDLLHLVNTFRQDMPRPIVGVGHSMGGAHLTQLALMHPRLIETIILIDPVIQSFFSPTGSGMPAQSSARRRDRWPSRAAAEEGFKKSRFYQPWDSRVLQRWVQYGLRELPTKLHHGEGKQHPFEQGEREVTLTTTKHQEVFTFLRATLSKIPAKGFTAAEWEKLSEILYPDFVEGKMERELGFYRPEPLLIFQNLKFLRPSVLYVFGEESALSSERGRTEKMATTGTSYGGSGGEKKGRVKEVMMKRTGHLIPMEKVQETAQESAEWLGAEMERWRSNEALVAKHWRSVDDLEKYTLSKETMARFGKDVFNLGKNGPKL